MTIWLWFLKLLVRHNTRIWSLEEHVTRCKDEQCPPVAVVPRGYPWPPTQELPPRAECPLVSPRRFSRVRRHCSRRLLRPQTRRNGQMTYPSAFSQASDTPPTKSIGRWIYFDSSTELEIPWELSLVMVWRGSLGVRKSRFCRQAEERRRKFR